MGEFTVLTFETESVEETLALGARFGSVLPPGCTIALIGGLGAGKTHFVKGVARGNDTPDHVTVNSPTFVLVNEYPGRIYLYHIDAYRLSGEDHLDSLGFEDMLADNGSVFVEWADRVEQDMPQDHVAITIEITGPTSRRFCFDATGPASDKALAALAS